MKVFNAFILLKEFFFTITGSECESRGALRCQNRHMAQATRAPSTCKHKYHNAKYNNNNNKIHILHVVVSSHGDSKEGWGWWGGI